jgi:ribose transport system permease protein
LAEVVGDSEAGRVSRTARNLGLGSLLSSLLFGSRFVTIWLAGGLLLLACQIFAPATISSTSWSAMLPLGSVVAIVALGQMLVIMVGGIDLSIGASISLLANILVGVSHGDNDRLAYAILVVLFWAVVIGLVNGILVAIVELNPIIVTLATGLVLLGITAEYRLGTAYSPSVPDALADVVFEKTFGISKAFWFVLFVAIVISLVLRSTAVGRRFQVVGANRAAAWMAGIHVRIYVVAAYVAAAIAAGTAGIILAGIVVNPGVNPGADYLLGPVAAVILAGAALTGGLASPMSTWAAAFFVQILSQMLKVLGISNAAQFVVFGLAIILGMLISGDRISQVIGWLLLRPGVQRLIEEGEMATVAADAGSSEVGRAVEPNPGQRGGEAVEGAETGGEGSPGPEGST